VTLFQVFLLSPASVSGARGRALLAGRSASDVAGRLRVGGAPLGDVYTFLSGLYFRGKLAYARRFARPPERGVHRLGGGVLVITPSRGLLPADRPVAITDLLDFADVDVRADNPRYRGPLEASLRELDRALDARTAVVLLGSIASDKYVGVIDAVLGARLRFPAAFVGRGDMSRGGLLLRAVAAGVELEYVPVAGAIRHGPRPARLERLN
jgi:hypothetical protein